MGIIVVILALLLATSIYAIWNLMKKLEIYEDFTQSVLADLKDIITNIKDIDLKGAFEADDEVGTVFQGIKAAILRLEKFLAQP